MIRKMSVLVIAVETLTAGLSRGNPTVTAHRFGRNEPERTNQKETKMYKLHIGGFTASLLIASCGALPAFACLPDLYCTVTFSVPGASQTVPTSINSSGAVAGYYATSGTFGSTVYGFVRDPDGTITTFAAPGGGPLCTAPNCGEGALFRKYLKVVDRCAAAARTSAISAPTTRRPI